MIKFSVKNQAAYDVSLDYPDLPDDLIEITHEQYQELNDAVNRGCYILTNLTYSEPKPSQFHKWINNEWSDPRSADEVIKYNRSILPVLSKRQFALQLNSVQVGETTLYKQMLAFIAQDETAQIEWDTVAYIERLSPTVLSMTFALGLTDEQVDVMWAEALIR